MSLIKPEKATPFDRKTALEKKLTEKMIALAQTHINTHTHVLEKDVYHLLTSNAINQKKGSQNFEKAKKKDKEINYNTVVAIK